MRCQLRPGCCCCCCFLRQCHGERRHRGVNRRRRIAPLNITPCKAAIEESRSASRGSFPAILRPLRKSQKCHGTFISGEGGFGGFSTPFFQSGGSECSLVEKPVAV